MATTLPRKPRWGEWAKIQSLLLTSEPPVDGFLSLTLAPILLTIGYVILIPMALLMKSQKELDEVSVGTDASSESPEG